MLEEALLGDLYMAEKKFLKPGRPTVNCGGEGRIERGWRKMLDQMEKEDIIDRKTIHRNRSDLFFSSPFFILIGFYPGSSS
jgi:hypothetical protein